mmetsp:Transcript_23446/g.47861  ORF Transcript_23446/g.47861 Transcript_23446/m.47861 type:complete len:465 (-) Transcript_23446:926-2320(-)
MSKIHGRGIFDGTARGGTFHRVGRSSQVHTANGCEFNGRPRRKISLVIQGRCYGIRKVGSEQLKIRDGSNLRKVEIYIEASSHGDFKARCTIRSDGEGVSAGSGVEGSGHNPSVPKLLDGGQSLVRPSDNGIGKTFIGDRRRELVDSGVDQLLKTRGVGTGGARGGDNSADRGDNSGGVPEIHSSSVVIPDERSGDTPTAFGVASIVIPRDGRATNALYFGSGSSPQDIVDANTNGVREDIGILTIRRFMQLRDVKAEFEGGISGRIPKASIDVEPKLGNAAFFHGLVKSAGIPRSGGVFGFPVFELDFDVAGGTGRVVHGVFVGHALRDTPPEVVAAAVFLASVEVIDALDFEHIFWVVSVVGADLVFVCPIRVIKSIGRLSGRLRTRFRRRRCTRHGGFGRFGTRSGGGLGRNGGYRGWPRRGGCGRSRNGGHRRDSRACGGIARWFLRHGWGRRGQQRRFR